MAQGHITKRAVDALNPSPKTDFLWDDEVKGFGLKVTPAGSRSYIFQYRMGGRTAKVRRHTIGAHGPWTPDQARKEAKRLSHMVDCGQDPGTIKQEKRHQDVALAFSSYAERFIVEYLQVEWKGSHELAAGLLRREAVPVLKSKPLTDIRRSDISAILDRMADRPASRRNTFAALRRLFRWAVGRGDIAASPIGEMEPPAAPASRDRVLSDSELSIVWHASEGLGYPFTYFVKLLILTGQRREEVAGLNWAELDRDQAMWILPAERSKNATAHHVPLSSGAIDLIDGIAHRFQQKSGTWPKQGFLLSSNGDKPSRGFSVAKSRLDKFCNELLKKRDHQFSSDDKLKPWRFHDLRRTCATGLQRLGVRFEVTESVLNHLSGSRSGIAGVYQRHTWATEKKAALQAWNDHVKAICPSTDADRTAL